MPRLLPCQRARIRGLTMADYTQQLRALLICIAKGGPLTKREEWWVNELNGADDKYHGLTPRQAEVIDDIHERVLKRQKLVAQMRDNAGSNGQGTTPPAGASTSSDWQQAPSSSEVKSTCNLCVRFLIPTHDNDRTPLDREIAKFRKSILLHSTYTESALVDGTWKMADGTVVTETNIPFTVHAPESAVEAIRTLVLDFGRKAGQDAMYWEQSISNVVFLDTGVERYTFHSSDGHSSRLSATVDDIPF